MIIGIPIWVGRKLYARFKTTSKHKRNIIIASGVASSVSPPSVPATQLRWQDPRRT